MKRSGLTIPELIDAYKKEIRSLLEIAAPVWNGAQTLDQSEQIEKIQQFSLAAILGSSYISYSQALGLAKLETLEHRREQICFKLINKNMKSENPLLHYI